MATILVADDDQLLRAIIRDHLDRAGHRVLEAGDGIAAIDIALDERPECLLLDVMMPLARGLEVVRRVRQEQAWHPVIAMVSARTRVTDRLNALDAGADVYIEKPFEPETLLAVIERHLRESARSRIVDVLGPIWTAVAVERLALDAVARRSPSRINTARVQELFADLVARNVGRMPMFGIDSAGGSVGAMRLIWEDALRALLRDATDRPIPTVTDLTAPDAWAAAERLIGNETLARHRASLTSTGRGDGVTGAWSRTLRSALGSADATAALTGRCRAALDQILRPGDAQPVATLDPLQTLWLAIAEETVAAECVEEPA